MRIISLATAFLFLAGHTAQSAAQAPRFQLPDSLIVREGPTGTRIEANELLRRLAGADFVLLGEVHDNALQHATRGRLIAAGCAAPGHRVRAVRGIRERDRSAQPGEARETWLDRNGFDRKSWKWPLHEPVVNAALQHGRSLWGANISRETLRPVVAGGESAAPAHLRPLMELAPLDDVARAAIDHELDVGHCGQLPAEMVPGMRAAQVVRDAAMTHALVRAGADGPAILIAGNGHVRRDMAVPRLLRVVAPGKSVVVVGFLERDAKGAEPAQAERAVYDVVVITPRAARPDPCAGLR
jgi:uncharacterized iron-regulated protein